MERTPPRDPNVRKYTSILKSLVAHLGDRQFVELQPLDVDEWLHAANHKGGREKARATRMANAASFMRLQNWALDVGLVKQKVVKALEKPKSAPRHTMPTDDELAKVLAIAEPDFAKMVRCLSWCSARPGQLAKAKVGEYDRDNSVIVLDKRKTDRTGQPRTLYVAKKMAALLAESLAARPPELQTPGSHLFLTADNEPWTTLQLSTTWAQLRKAACINPRARLYDLRHCFCTAVAAVHGIAVAQILAGHTNIQTTTLYVHQDKEKLLGILDDIGDIKTA